MKRTCNSESLPLATTGSLGAAGFFRLGRGRNVRFRGRFLDADGFGGRGNVLDRHFLGGNLAFDFGRGSFVLQVELNVAGRLGGSFLDGRRRGNFGGRFFVLDGFLGGQRMIGGQLDLRFGLGGRRGGGGGGGRAGRDFADAEALGVFLGLLTEGRGEQLADLFLHLISAYRQRVRRQILEDFLQWQRDFRQVGLGIEYFLVAFRQSLDEHRPGHGHFAGAHLRLDQGKGQ